jgi:nucleotide-binding universal stress UspA family protein
MTTAPPTHIVVGVDGSLGSDEALRWAAEEAELHGATLTAVMTWGFLDQHPSDGAPFDPHFDETSALAQLREHLERTLGPERSEAVEPRAICDLAARGLVEASTDADLLVVGARGLGGFKGLLLGSVSQHCLQHATVPVAVIRANDRRDIVPTGIIVAVDGSPTADLALAWAAAEARQRKTTLAVVHAWQPHAVGHDPAAALRTARLDDVSDETIVAALARADTTRIAEVRSVVRRGSPSRVILDAASNAELIVLGTRGRGAIKRMLLGSVAMQVAHDAAAPIVVIPHSDEPRGS